MESLSRVRRKLDCLARGLRGKYLGRDVILVGGSRDGRLARIEDVILNEAGPLFLCMVYRTDGSGEFLNSTADTRSYLPPEEFRIIAHDQKRRGSAWAWFVRRMDLLWTRLEEKPDFRLKRGTHEPPESWIQRMRMYAK